MAYAIHPHSLLWCLNDYCIISFFSSGCTTIRFLWRRSAPENIQEMLVDDDGRAEEAGRDRHSAAGAADVRCDMGDSTPVR